MGKAIVLLVFVAGCGAQGLNEPSAKQPSCHFDLVAPNASGDTCADSVDTFDVHADIASVGHVETVLGKNGYRPIDGERYNLALESILMLDNKPCLLGHLDVDALPPHWLVSVDAQCGSVPITGTIYGDE